MIIRTRDIDIKNTEVIIEHENTKINLGILSIQERLKLGQHLREIAEELCSDIEEPFDENKCIKRSVKYDNKEGIMYLKGLKM